MRTVTQTDVFHKTVPFIIERHYFGEQRGASLAGVETATDKTFLALSKRLLNMPETVAIHGCDGRYRAWLRTVATPWRSGIWLVPFGLIDAVVEHTKAYDAERGKLADAAAAAYPAAVEAMREPLGPLFNPLDYPSKARFRAKWSIDYRFVELGTPGVLEQLKPELFAQEKAKLTASAGKVRVQIEQHLATALLDITTHLQGLLTPRANGKRAAVRDGALDRLFTFLDTIELRDVTNFAALRKVTTQLKRAAKGVTVEQLRTDDDLRAALAGTMAYAKDAVSALVVDDEIGAGRTIILRDEVSA
jgi:hypothetical protein